VKTMKNLIVADNWYRQKYLRGASNMTVQVDWDRDALQGLTDEIAVEQAEHYARAGHYAAKRTGYTWTVDDLTSDAAKDYSVLQRIEYQRLEACAVERRILAVADCVRSVACAS